MTPEHKGETNGELLSQLPASIHAEVKKDLKLLKKGKPSERSLEKDGAILRIDALIREYNTEFRGLIRPTQVTQSLVRFAKKRLGESADLMFLWQSWACDAVHAFVQQNTVEGKEEPATSVPIQARVALIRLARMLRKPLAMIREEMDLMSLRKTDVWEKAFAEIDTKQLLMKLAPHIPDLQKVMQECTGKNANLHEKPHFNGTPPPSVMSERKISEKNTTTGVAPRKKKKTEKNTENGVLNENTEDDAQEEMLKEIADTEYEPDESDLALLEAEPLDLLDIDFDDLPTEKLMNDNVRRFMKQSRPLLTLAEEQTIARRRDVVLDQWTASVLQTPAGQRLAMHILLATKNDYRASQRAVKSYKMEGADLRFKLKEELPLLVECIEQRTEAHRKNLKHYASGKIQKTPRAAEASNELNNRLGSIPLSLASLRKIETALKKLQNQFIAFERDGKKVTNNEEAKDLMLTYAISPVELDEILRSIEKAHGEFSETQDDLSLSNIRLVVSIAKKYRYRGLTFEELLQTGMLGVMTAAERYEWERGYKFSTYAHWWIRQSITREIMKTARRVHVPMHIQGHVGPIRRAIDNYKSDHEGRVPSDEYLSKILDKPVNIIKEVLKACGFQGLSLDTTVGENENNTISEFLEDKKAVQPDDDSGVHEIQQGVHDVLRTLHPREREIMKLRYGIGTGLPEMTLDEVAKQMEGITRERVRQIEGKAIRKLQNVLSGPRRRLADIWRANLPENADVKQFRLQGYSIGAKLNAQRRLQSASSKSEEESAA